MGKGACWINKEYKKLCLEKIAWNLERVKWRIGLDYAVDECLVWDPEEA